MKAALSRTFLWCCLSRSSVPSLDSVDEILKCDHSNESYWAVFSCSAVYYVVQGGYNFCVWTKSESVTIQMKAIEQYFPVALFIMLYMVVLTCDSEIIFWFKKGVYGTVYLLHCTRWFCLLSLSVNPKGDHLNESSVFRSTVWNSACFSRTF